MSAIGILLALLFFAASLTPSLMPRSWLIQGLLSEHGIPSMLRRAAGWDVPDFLAAGPREVLVAEELAERAREVLEGTPGEG